MAGYRLFVSSIISNSKNKTINSNENFSKLIMVHINLRWKMLNCYEFLLVMQSISLRIIHISLYLFLTVLTCICYGNRIIPPCSVYIWSLTFLTAINVLLYVYHSCLCVCVCLYVCVCPFLWPYTYFDNQVPEISKPCYMLWTWTFDCCEPHMQKKQAHHINIFTLHRITVGIFLVVVMHVCTIVS